MTYAYIRGVAACLALLGLAVSPAHAEPRDPWVRAWGANTAGQLGNGSTLVQQTPADVQGLARADVRELAGGGGNDANAFAVALLDDGTVQAWGGNTNGQLGDGTTTGRSFPAAVAGLSGVSQVAAGVHFAFAVRGGRVLAWGYNADGQLGNDSTGHSSVPVDVRHLDGVARVFACGYHSFAVLDDGAVRAWGWNGFGQLGDGSTASRTTPVPVPDLTGVRGLAGGYNHTIAVLDDGSVLGWGENAAAQLGDASTTNSLSPVVALPPDSGATRVATSTVWKSSYAY